MERQTLISDLVGGAYPPAVAVGGRLRRNWIARTANVLPGEAELNALQQGTEADAIAKIQDAYASVATAEQLANARPSVTLVRLDDHHLIVRIEFAAPENSVGDVAAIAQWGVLQVIDRNLRLDELQGIPCEHWFPIRAGREAK
jgi:hypothetical protein